MKYLITGLLITVSTLFANPSSYLNKIYSSQHISLERDTFFEESRAFFDFLSLKPKEACAPINLLERIAAVKPSSLYLRMTQDLFENEEFMNELQNMFTDFYLFKTGTTDFYDPQFESFIMIASCYTIKEPNYLSDLNILEFYLADERREFVHHYAILQDQSDQQWTECTKYIKKNALVDGLAFSVVGEVNATDAMTKLQKAFTDHTFCFTLNVSDYKFDGFTNSYQYFGMAPIYSPDEYDSEASIGGRLTYSTEDGLKIEADAKCQATNKESEISFSAEAKGSVQKDTSGKVSGEFEIGISSEH